MSLKGIFSSFKSGSTTKRRGEKRRAEKGVLFQKGVCRNNKNLTNIIDKQSININIYKIGLCHSVAIL